MRSGGSAWQMLEQAFFTQKQDLLEGEEDALCLGGVAPMLQRPKSHPPLSFAPPCVAPPPPPDPPGLAAPLAPTASTLTPAISPPHFLV